MAQIVCDVLDLLATALQLRLWVRDDAFELLDLIDDELIVRVTLFPLNHGLELMAVKMRHGTATIVAPLSPFRFIWLVDLLYDLPGTIQLTLLLVPKH